MSSYFVSTTMTTDQRDLALATWYALGMLGCEEEAVGGDVRVRVFFGDLQAADLACKELSKLETLSPVITGEVENQDWNAKWRESMKPARIAPHFWVSPEWLPPPIGEKDRWIKIEPKMAFGTGHHESTRLAAAGIVKQMRSKHVRRVLDIGTGSGVLCFVADMCGAAFCTGIEIDPNCRENLAENRAQNPASGKVGFVVGPIDCIDVATRFDLIVMNMIFTESAPLLENVKHLLSDTGYLVWSGILDDENQETIDRASTAGFKLIDHRTEHEWWCGTFTKQER